VTFEVRHGEVVGVIGRNGAGKSTLLKVLSRITEPTAGRVELRGRVGSLLEVGTGFHPELSGRENVFLNGAILGMGRSEIARKFDEIVAFAEVEKFLDTPVKHYSSGMYTRLAFAVAAHLEPEVLVVDEVLAVGDAEFQKKCLGKMGEVAKQGRTVLFVSHNMAAVQSLCTRGVLLRAGRVAVQGNVGDALAAYLADKASQRATPRAVQRPLGGGISLEHFAVYPSSPTADDHLTIEFALRSASPTLLGHLCLIVYSAYDVRVGVIDLRPRRPPYVIPLEKRLSVRCRLNPTMLVEGDYQFGLYLVAGDTIVNVTDVFHIAISASADMASGSDAFIAYPAQHRGVIDFRYTSEIVEYRD
jgi:lipopolysaccharide transport system ATP-binding protein